MTKSDCLIARLLLLIYPVGILVQIIRFADDIPMIADSEENFKRLLLNLDKTLKHDHNMKVNKTKTRILVCSRQQIESNIKIDNIKLENAHSFTNLGCKITNERKNTLDISCRRL